MEWHSFSHIIPMLFPIKILYLSIHGSSTILILLLLLTQSHKTIYAEQKIPNMTHKSADCRDNNKPHTYFQVFV